MGVLKTLGLSLVLALAATSARSDIDLVQHVSTCVGRYSAQMEHHWLFEDMPTTTIERQRAHLIDILETLTTPENAHSVLSRRIDAKMAHASLLTQAVFGLNTRVNTWAKARAASQLRACSDITLARDAAAERHFVSTSNAQTEPEAVNQQAVRALKQN